MTTVTAIRPPEPPIAQALSDSLQELDTGIDVVRLAHAFLRDHLEGHEHSMLFGALDVALDRLCDVQLQLDALALRADGELQRSLSALRTKHEAGEPQS